MHGVAYCFNGKIKVVPEYEIAGSFDPVDWAVLMGDKIIAKKDDIEKSISQNTVQLHFAIQRNLRLRSEHTSTELYGIVTTALEWFIIKAIETDCIEESIDVTITNYQLKVYQNVSQVSHKLTKLINTSYLCQILY